MTARRTALVFGASGFIGRWLVHELRAQGVAVRTAVRTERSFTRLTERLAAHGAKGDIEPVLVDFSAADLGLLTTDPSLSAVTEVYNVAGAYRFGMTPAEAREANVVSAERVVEWAAGLSQLVRLVHLSGYRVGGQDPASVPWSPERTREEYRRLGAYEASKVESDAVVQAAATRLGVPWSIVNPATVIGHSQTGESEQVLGVAGTVHDLWLGRLAALPGSDRISVPVVTVDYLAAFMSRLPGDAGTDGESFWLLDTKTPPFPRLVQMLAAHLGVRAPRLRIPVWLLRVLPQSITRADPETVTFLSADRYPTASADRFAARHGLTQPDITNSLTRWADYLVAHRFGDGEGGEGTDRVHSRRGYTIVRNARAFSLGPAGAQTIVLPGLPVNADTWAAVASQIDAEVIDLPGLGLTPADQGDWAGWVDWLDRVIGGRTGVHLVGHSLGAGLALEYASAHPDSVETLSLVASHFLQPRAPFVQRITPAVRAVLRRTTASRLSTFVTGGPSHAAALETSAADLRRGTAARTARWLRAASGHQRRRQLQELLVAYQGRVQLVAGSADPLTVRLPEREREWSRTRIIPGAGHHPQLSHPVELAEQLCGE